MSIWVTIIAVVLLPACSSSHTPGRDGGEADAAEASMPHNTGPPVRLGCDAEACHQFCCHDEHGDFCCHGNGRVDGEWRCNGAAPCINGDWCCDNELDGGHCVSGSDFFSPLCRPYM